MMISSVCLPQPSQPSSASSANDEAPPLMSSQEADVEIMHRVVAKDQQAFEILYARYAPRLASFLARRLPHAPEAKRWPLPQHQWI